MKNTFIHAATGGLLAKDASEKITVKAIDNLSFDISEGDRVGILGHNGSGKSTLLRAMVGAYEPTLGSIQVTGKVASMLSITLGMDMDATGYENIFIRAAIMGMKPKEIEPLVQEICDFSELGDYIYMPVRTYSSGMAMRLAFAVSTSVTSDIVLMDEWLSVGDADFSKKAQNRLERMVDSAKILVIASHDSKLVKKNCNKIINLEHGRMVSMESL